MPRMHWKATFIVLILLISLFIGWKIFNHSKPIALNSPNAHTNKAESTNNKSSRISETNSIIRDRSEPSLFNEKQLQKSYSCASGEKCPSALIAKSPAEALWLANAGYPTPEQVKLAQNLPLTELEKESKNSPAMRTLYGERLLKEGKQVEASDEIRKSIALGSIYGLYKLSDVYGTKGLLQDDMMSLAALRVAYLMGDGNAAGALYEKTGNMSAIEMKMVDEQAMVLYRRVLIDRYRVVGYGINVAPRP